jgi:crooked neck
MSKTVVPRKFREKLSFSELQESFSEMEKSKSTAIRSGRVKNRAPAQIQITAEQILREAVENQEVEKPKPKQKITDLEELEEYRGRKRKAFEDTIRKNRNLVGNWIKYAKWEESQKDFERARSIFERALDIDYKNTTTWLRYSEMEMKNKFINHARNVWDRAVQLLPRIDQFWYKYAYMEEMLGNVIGARKVYERWLEWQPDSNAWKTYIKMEVRYGEIEKARKVLDRFIRIHPHVENWIYYARFEEKQNEIQNAREIFEHGIEFFIGKPNEEKIFIEFAKFEERSNEIERARVIYKYALDNVPKDLAKDIYKRFNEFEKQHGDRKGIEDVITGKKRFQYEEEIKKNPENYDLWFEYIRLEEDNHDKLVEVFERAIANIPPIQEKKYWKRYIYLWLNYAIFTELTAKDVEKTREIFKSCLEIIPHKKFSFSKVWILFAQFELRQKNLEEMRKILGRAIGITPKEKLFKSYISIEYSLGNVDRVRILYEKYLEFNPSNCEAWKDYATLEEKLSEIERSRSIYELAINQNELDMPELIWKCYIDFEIKQKEFDHTRKLYENLLERTKHVKVWTSFALFESSIDEVDKARDIYSRSYQYFKSGSMEKDENELDLKEQRLMLLESWKEFEEKHGNDDSVESVVKKFPKRIKKRRPVESADGSRGYLWEEYYDYIFPDDENTNSNSKLKILEIAHQWKKKRRIEEGGSMPSK